MKDSASILIWTSILLLVSSATTVCHAYPEPRDPSKVRPFAGLKLHDEKRPLLSAFGKSDPRVSTWDVVPRGGGLGVVKDWIPSKGATARFANVVFWILGLTSAADAVRGWEHTGLKVARGSLAEWLSERHGYGRVPSIAPLMQIMCVSTQRAHSTLSSRVPFISVGF
jgi:hypothetical protein